MVRGEHDRLPHRPLVALGVAQQAERPARRAVEPRGERRARGQREAVSERPGREVDSGDAALRVRPEPRAVRAVGRQLLVREPVAQVERGIDRQARVPLREDEPVAVGVTRDRRSRTSAYSGGDDVRDGERRADVADTRAHGLLEDDAPNALGERVEVLRVGAPRGRPLRQRPARAHRRFPTSRTT